MAKFVRLDGNVTEVYRNKPDALFLFIDNIDRKNDSVDVFSSYRILSDSEYALRFRLKDLRVAGFNNPSAWLRGRERAYPFTVRKRCEDRRFYDLNDTYTLTDQMHWTDRDFDTFKRYVDDDMHHIMKAIMKYRPSVIYAPQYGFLDSSNETRINSVSTPKLHRYIIEREYQIYRMLEDYGVKT